MNIAVTIRTEIEFSELDDINEARDIIVEEMAADEILELAQRQGSHVNIDVEEY